MAKKNGFKFDLDAVKRANAKAFEREQIGTGTRAIFTQEASVITSEKEFNAGATQLVLKQQYLADAEDPTSVIDGTKHTRYVTLPLPNPDTGYEPRRGEAAAWTSLCGALGLVDMPIYSKTTKSSWLRGEEVSKLEVPNLQLMASDKATELAAEIMESRDASQLVGRVYFADVSYWTNPDTDVTSTYPSFGRPRQELVGDETLSEDPPTMSASPTSPGGKNKPNGVTKKGARSGREARA